MKTKISTILFTILMVLLAFTLVACDLSDNIIEETHQHEWGEWETDLEPTCVTPGKRTRYCLDCDKSETETIPTIEAHHASDWIVDSYATCAEEGSQHKECTVCSKILETQSIPITAIHESYTWVIVSEPKCDKAGEKHKVCDTCKTTLDAEEISPSHKFENDICSICNCSNTILFIFKYLEKTNS